MLSVCFVFKYFWIHEGFPWLELCTVPYNYNIINLNTLIASNNASLEVNQVLAIWCVFINKLKKTQQFVFNSFTSLKLKWQICQVEVKGICYAILIFVQCILCLRSMFILNMAKVSNNKSQKLIVQTTLNTWFPTAFIYSWLCLVSKKRNVPHMVFWGIFTVNISFFFFFFLLFNRCDNCRSFVTEILKRIGSRHHRRWSTLLMCTYQNLEAVRR